MISHVCNKIESCQKAFADFTEMYSEVFKDWSDFEELTSIFVDTIELLMSTGALEESSDSIVVTPGRIFSEIEITLVRMATALARTKINLFDA